MTERLYRDDPYLSVFSARIREVRVLDGQRAVVLDRSAFYPEGGGQPGDRGWLAPAPAGVARQPGDRGWLAPAPAGVAPVQVLDTQERDGELLHLVAADAALPEPAAGVEGRLDWTRRFDHMQQHHGQHLLSAAFERVLAAPTRSFHLGEKSCTIDLACALGLLDGPALRRVEAVANESVWRDLPVVARDFEGEERAKLTLRKEAVKGNRVVVVEGVDASPCGGTHPRRTGEVGAIAVVRAQRWGDGLSRVEFVCGGRVVARLAEAEGAVAGAAEALKAAPSGLAEAVRRLAAEAHARRKAIEGLEAELSLHRARDLALAQPSGAVVGTFAGGASTARAVASALAAQGRIALVAAVEDGRAHLVFARAKGAGPALDALLREAVTTLGGKGGGSPEHAQGSGDAARLSEALAAAAGRLR